MLLTLHIVSAVIGIIGAYLLSGAFFFSPLRSLVKVGRWCTTIGLVGTILTGASLFASNVPKFLASGKFLSNLTIILILLAVEAFFPVLKKDNSRTINRALSLLSWTWIFIMALLNPPFPYWQFMLAYLALASLLAWIISRQFPHHSRPTVSSPS